MTHERRSCPKEMPYNLPGHVSSRLKPSERELQTINLSIYPNSNTFVNIKHENDISVIFRNIFLKCTVMLKLRIYKLACCIFKSDKTLRVSHDNPYIKSMITTVTYGAFVGPTIKRL